MSKNDAWFFLIILNLLALCSIIQPLSSRHIFAFPIDKENPPVIGNKSISLCMIRTIGIHWEKMLLSNFILSGVFVCLFIDLSNKLAPLIIDN